MDYQLGQNHPYEYAARMNAPPPQPMFNFPSPAHLADYCNKLQQDYQLLEKKFILAKQEALLHKEKKDELQQHFLKGQSHIAKLTLECGKLTDTVNKFTDLFQSVITQLPPQNQAVYKEQFDRMQHQVQMIYEEQARKLTLPEEFDVPHRRNSVHEIPKTEVTSPESKEEEYDEEEEDEISELAIQKKQRTGRTSVSPITVDPDSRRGEDHHDRLSPTKKKTHKRSTSRNSVSISPVPPMSTSVGVPKSARVLATLPHGDPVGALLFNSSGSHLYTGGKGSVKIWDLKGSPINKPVAELRCFDTFIRGIKLAENDKTLIVVGESHIVTVWNLDSQSPHVKHRLTLNSHAYCVGINNQSNETVFYVGCADGGICGFDITTGQQIKSFAGHLGPVSAIEVSPDGSKILSGSLDGSLKIWDVSSAKEVGSYTFPSQIFSLTVCPGESWVAVGLENSHIEVINMMNSEGKYQLHLHENCVLNVKFANNSKWFVSTSKDKSLYTWRSPFGPSIFQCKEPNTIFCADISPDDSLLATGSGERLATLYEIIY